VKLPVIRTRVQVRYSDTDALGHISSGSYVTFMEVGRLELYETTFAQMGYRLETVMANLHLDYLKECKYGDEIEVVTWCSKIGTKSLVISHEIFANGNLVATGSATNVGFDPETRRSMALPADWQASSYNPSTPQANP